LLEHLLLPCILADESRQLASVDAGVQLEQVADRLDTLDGDNIGEEEVDIAGGGVLRGVGNIRLEKLIVFIWRRVDGEVFWAGGEEEVFVGGKGVITTESA
jgi:hypothetical protein